MNDRISQIITVVLNNIVLSAETNFAATHRFLKENLPKMYHYRKFLDEVKSKDSFTITVEEKVYHIQIIRNEKK